MLTSFVQASTVAAPEMNIPGRFEVLSLANRSNWRERANGILRLRLKDFSYARGSSTRRMYTGGESAAHLAPSRVGCSGSENLTLASENLVIRPEDYHERSFSVCPCLRFWWAIEYLLVPGAIERYPAYNDRYEHRASQINQ